MHLQDGKSQREISKITGIDRKTIRRYIKNYEQKREELMKNKNGGDVSKLIDDIVESPKYTVGERGKRKLTPEIEQKIKDHLDENEQKQRKGQHKQKKKIVDIYEALLNEEEGFNISYSTVQRTVRRLEQKPKEAFIKSSYLPGDVCEFDWGEVKITIGGQFRTLQLAVFTSANENYRWAYLFTKQTTECFQESHARFFEHVGGVFPTLVYDNMKVAVKKLTGTEKEPTKGLLQLSIYYGFKFRFCNVGRGNEKGHVERSVEVVRRKAFGFKDTFENLDEANHYLESVCQKLNRQSHEWNNGETAEEKLRQAQKYLLDLPPMFDAARTLTARVDKYSTITVDQNRYSVPDSLVGKVVFVKVYSNRILCFTNDKKIAEHARKTGSHEWGLQLEHYLGTLMKKPGALASSIALQQADKNIKKIYDLYFINKAKEFIELLHYIKEKNNLNEVMCAIDQLKNHHPNHVTTAKIKILCNKQENILIPVPVSPESKKIAEYSKHHLKMYGELFQESSESEVYTA